MAIPERTDRLSRVKLAESLTEVGFTVSASTLATKAVRGGGPPFEKFGPRAVYVWGPSYDWAVSRLTPVRANTSERDVA